MQCPGCRKPVPEGAKFCGFCGAALSPAVPHPTVRGEAPPVSGPEAGPGAVFRVAGPEEAAPSEAVGEAGRRGFPWVLVWALAGAGLAFLVYWFGVGRTGRGIPWPQRPNPAMDQFSWSRAYGGPGEDGATAIASTPDGGYIVAGWTESFGVGKKDVWVLKLDGRGNVEWQKTYGGPDWDAAEAIAPTSDGGYVVMGKTGASDVWVLKLGGHGGVQWQKTYKLPDIGEEGDPRWPDAFSPASDGGYVVAGWTESLGIRSDSFWVVKLDGQGSVQWLKTYGPNEAHAIAPTSDGGYVVAGRILIGAEVEGIWLLKLDGRGNVEWQKAYGGPDDDGAKAIAPTPDGGYVVAGWTESFGVGERDVWVLKLDGRGNVEWQKAYGGPDWDEAEAIAPTSDGGYVVAGMTRSFGAGDYDVWVLKLDNLGNVHWQRTYGGPGEDEAHAIAPTSDGGYVVAGETESFGAGKRDAWVLKLDGQGNVQGCPSGLVRDSTASVAPTTVSPRNSSAVVRTISASVRASSATVETTSVLPTPVCRGE